VEGEKPLGEDVTASIKAAADASRSNATASALQSNTNTWRTKLNFWDKSSDGSSQRNEKAQTTTKGQKPDDSSR
jgi:hypothetical protein